MKFEIFTGKPEEYGIINGEHRLIKPKSRGPYIYDIHEKCPIFAPPPPFSVCPNGSKLGTTPPPLDVKTLATVWNTVWTLITLILIIVLAIQFLWIPSPSPHL